jgi:hypothetical protein
MSSDLTHDARWTRAHLLRAALGGGAVLAGGAALGAAREDAAPLAAPSQAGDEKILNLFLLLERVQESFYRRAIESGKLDGELLRFATAAADQESAHVAFLTKRLGSGARSTGPANAEAPATAAAFRDSAIALEETAIAAYIGQSANLTRPAIAPIAVLTSVEARQVAWVRDLAGVSPAPRAADPARSAASVTAELRHKGFIR